MAQVYHRQGKLDRAARSLDLAIQRQPQLPELFRARAFLVSRAHENGGIKFRDATPEKQAQAIRDLKTAIRLEPAESSQARDDQVELGRLFFATGQTKEALEAYEAAIRIDPNDLGALRLRLALLELERFDEVLAASDAFLSRGKLSTDLLAIRGQARFARKDFAGAIADDTVALTLTPGATELLDQRLGLSFFRSLQSRPGRLRRRDQAGLRSRARLQRPGARPRRAWELARGPGRCRHRRPPGLGD